MSDPILSAELTPEELAGYQEDAAALAVKYKVSKVHVYVAIAPETNERVVGFLKEPSYLQKIVALDKIATVGPFMAGDELREVLTIREESDPRTFDISSNCDCYRMGMTGACIPIIDMIKNSFKKK